jgi:hypothetical protein
MSWVDSVAKKGVKVMENMQDYGVVAATIPLFFRLSQVGLTAGGMTDSAEVLQQIADMTSLSLMVCLTDAIIYILTIFAPIMDKSITIPEKMKGLDIKRRGLEFMLATTAAALLLT